MSRQGPTHWDPWSSPDFRNYLKKAKAAGKKGDPDPSKSDKAPACFDSLYQMAMDQLHHEAGFMLDDLLLDRQIIAAHEHIEPEVGAGADLTEDLERHLMQLRSARVRIVGRVQRFRTECHSIKANWARMDREMQEVYRKYYPYANHVGELRFPQLDLTAIRYGDEDGGFGLGVLLPGQQHSDGRPSAAIRRVLSQ